MIAVSGAIQGWRTCKFLTKALQLLVVGGVAFSSRERFNRIRVNPRSLAFEISLSWIGERYGKCQQILDCIISHSSRRVFVSPSQLGATIRHRDEFKTARDKASGAASVAARCSSAGTDHRRKEGFCV